MLYVDTFNVFPALTKISKQAKSRVLYFATNHELLEQWDLTHQKADAVN